MQDARALRRFEELLPYISDGELLARIDKAFEDALTQLAQEGAGKKAKITIDINLERKGGRQMEIVGDVTLKSPKPAKLDPSTLWTAPGGGLSLEHPNQMTMFPRGPTRADAE